MATVSEVAPVGATAARTLLVATAVGGGSGFLVMAVAGPALGPARYAAFAAFW